MHARFALHVPLAHKVFWTQPMVLLGDEAHVEPRFDPFVDSVCVGARKVLGLRRTYHRLGNHSRCTR